MPRLTIFDRYYRDSKALEKLGIAEEEALMRCDELRQGLSGSVSTELLVKIQDAEQAHGKAVKEHMEATTKLDGLIAEIREFFDNNPDVEEVKMPFNGGFICFTVDDDQRINMFSSER